MKCYCCDRDVSLVHRVELRGNPTIEDFRQLRFLSPDDPACQAYLDDCTYRTAFICPGCYHTLDNATGLGEVAGRTFNLAGKSRGSKAAVYNEAKYQDYQRREAEKLGQ